MLSWLSLIFAVSLVNGAFVQAYPTRPDHSRRKFYARDGGTDLVSFQGYTYQGCYAISDISTGVKQTSVAASLMSQEACLAGGGVPNTAVIGLAAGNICMAFPSLPANAVKSTKCNVLCSGRETQLCGGSGNTFSIYISTDPATNPVSVAAPVISVTSVGTSSMTIQSSSSQLSSTTTSTSASSTTIQKSSIAASPTKVSSTIVVNAASAAPSVNPNTSPSSTAAPKPTSTVITTKYKSSPPENKMSPGYCPSVGDGWVWQVVTDDKTTCKSLISAVANEGEWQAGRIAWQSYSVNTNIGVPLVDADCAPNIAKGTHLCVWQKAEFPSALFTAPTVTIT